MTTPYLSRQAKRRMGCSPLSNVRSNGAVIRPTNMGVLLNTVHDETAEFKSGNAALDAACRAIRLAFDAAQPVMEAA